jgi:hypothetical protein
MPILRRLRRTSTRFHIQARAVVQAAARAVTRWWRQPVAAALEAERIDRIRNPAKYLGKP